MFQQGCAECVVALEVDGGISGKRTLIMFDVCGFCSQCLRDVLRRYLSFPEE